MRKSPHDTSSRLQERVLIKYMGFAARQTKPNPLVRKREEGQQTRRQLFLKNVRGRADEKAFERRSIEGHAIRRWHEEQQQIFQQRENDAAGMPTERDIEDAANLADQQFSQQIFEDVDSLMADEAARQEQLELEALLASYESPIPVSNAQPFSQRPPSIYISDDEEYDQIFMELAGDETVLVEDMEMS
ncbi:unnamed protein product [Parascedosporium putredinis]|uniref:Uncharacterized protein n=1 Tax=Parascedosporium putredinis TaxID=1442378 RepID=A0A9P1H4U8_9PEZI|nr:unnamed protein product [Parascedosporium putredinis]CAI7995913.1 unnamed protein product [Parascedosporium putredinis]